MSTELMYKVSTALPTLAREIALAVDAVAGEHVPIVLVLFTQPRASYIYTCPTREEAIHAIEQTLDRFAHPDDPTYGRVAFEEASSAAQRIALGARYLTAVVEDAVDRLIGVSVPLALFLLQAPHPPTYMGSHARGELVPAMEELVAAMRADHADVPAHEFREH